MKPEFPLGARGTCIKRIAAATVALVFLAACHVASAQTGDQPPVAAAPPAAPARPVLPWISDVAKLTEAGVPKEVIQSYIRNSTARSFVTPDDIVYLRGHGVASDVITTMIEHGAAVAPVNTAAAPPPAAVAQPQPAAQPAQDYSAATQAYVPPADNYYYDNTYPAPYYPYYYSTGFYDPFVFFVGPRFGFRSRPFFRGGFRPFGTPGLRGGVHFGGGFRGGRR